MSTTTDFDIAIATVADTCGVDQHKAVDIIYSRPKAGDPSEPWTVRVFTQATRSRVYKQRIITGSGETIDKAASAAIDAVCEAFRAGDITTPGGVRAQALANFDARAKDIKAGRERESLIACAMELENWSREEAEERVDRALAK